MPNGAVCCSAWHRCHVLGLFLRCLLVMLQVFACKLSKKYPSLELRFGTQAAPFIPTSAQKRC